MLFDVGDLLALGAGDAELEGQIGRELRGLADELNSSLPEYEVRLIHLDTYDYLEFVSRDEEDRRQFIEEMLPSEED